MSGVCWVCGNESSCWISFIDVSVNDLFVFGFVVVEYEFVVDRGVVLVVRIVDFDCWEEWVYVKGMGFVRNDWDDVWSEIFVVYKVFE